MDGSDLDEKTRRFASYATGGGRTGSRNEGSIYRQVLRRLIPRRVRPAAVLAATRARMPLERLRARRLARPGMKLHLGSGTLRKSGWVNIDLAGQPVDLVWDLRYPLPFPDGIAAAVFHEHLLEHLPLQAGLFLTRECNRLLRPGGLLRIGVPDTGAYLRSYEDDTSGFLEGNRPNRPTRLLAIQEVFYGYGHTTMYDFDTLDVLCRSAGFTDVAVRKFGESRALDPCPDSVERRSETLYVEAIK